MPEGFVSVKADVKEVEKYLTRIEKKQLPFATALSLTRTAQHIQKRTMPRVLPRIFDRPTRWAINGFFIIPASKRSALGAMTAAVHIKDGVTKEPSRGRGGSKIGTPAFNFFKPAIEGTPRNAKSHEKKLRALGILRGDEYTVPGEEIPLNRYGNPKGRFYSRIVAEIGASRGAGIAEGYGQATTRRGGKKYFYSPNLRPRGIYERQRRGRGFLRVALLFVKQPKYKKRFDFQGISRRAAVKRWPLEFRKALDRALATAR